MNAKQLKALRTRHNLSIRQAAVLCGIAPVTWWLTEKGRNELRPETIEKITNAIKANKQG